MYCINKVLYNAHKKKCCFYTKTVSCVCQNFTMIKTVELFLLERKKGIHTVDFKVSVEFDSIFYCINKVLYNTNKRKKKVLR